MKEIKGTFNYYFSHIHNGSHRTSDGFKYRYCDTYGVDGPYFNVKLSLSYQDLFLLNRFANSIKTKYFSQEEDYEWAESYTSNETSNDSRDLGLCEFFNENFSEKYDILLSDGCLEECIYSIDEMPSMKCFKEAFQKSSDFQQEEKEKLQHQIAQIKHQLSNLEHDLTTVESSDTFDNKLLSTLHIPLKDNPQIFDLNRPFFKNFFPLDVAIHNQDEELIDELISNGAYSYSSELIPDISARCGDFVKALALLKTTPVSVKDIFKIFMLIALLPNVEIISFFENKSDLVRDERILISYWDKLRLLVCIKNYYYTRGYQSPSDKYREPFRIVMDFLLKAGNLQRANYIYTVSKKHHYNFGFDEDSMLELSFKYGNIDFLNKIDLWTLVSSITDTVKYSYAFKRYEYDPWGDKLSFKWNFEPYIKPEIIGDELYNKIMDQVENHSSSYMF